MVEQSRRNKRAEDLETNSIGGQSSEARGHPEEGSVVHVLCTRNWEGKNHNLKASQKKEALSLFIYTGINQEVKGEAMSSSEKTFCAATIDV